MSMLVRKGTMMHRNSNRRHSRRNSTAAVRRPRSASMVPLGTASSSSAVAGTSSPLMNIGGGISPSTSRSASSDRRFSRATITGAEAPSNLSAATRLSAVSHAPLYQTSSTPSLTAQQTDSRRASSATSQMSSDERKKLYRTKVSRYKDEESGAVTSYNSVSYQLRDASSDATGMCDFVSQALEILAKTSLVTVILLAYMMLAIVMVIFGVQNLRECPKEPNIPLYLLIGGCFGALKMATLLWRQSKCRRYERLDDSFSDDYDTLASSTSTKVTEGALTLFLLAWFALGNHWVFGIYKPRFRALLLEPRNWCNENVYVFALVQIYICYSTFAVLVLVVVFLILLYKSGCL